MRKAILLTMGRTGSSWVCDLLNSHPHAACLYEVLKDHKELTQEQRVDLIQNKLTDSKDQLTVAKLLFYQLEVNVLERFIKDNDFEFYLIQRNPIDRFVSLKLAELTGTWHLDYMINDEVVSRGLSDIFKGKYSLKEIFQRIKEGINSYWSKLTYQPQKININIKELQESIDYEAKMIAMARSWLKQTDGELKILKYEDLPLDDDQKRDQIICDFFKLKRHSLQSSRQKIDWHSLEERVLNFSELPKISY